MIQRASRLKIVHISNQGRIIRILGSGLGISIIANFHTEGIVGKVQHIVMDEGATTDTLAIDSGAVGASKVTHQQTFRRPHQNAMKFGNTFVVEFQIGFLGPSHKGQISAKLDGATAFNRYQRYTQPQVSSRWEQICFL